MAERKVASLILLAAVIGLIVGSIGTYAIMQWTAKISSRAQLKLVGVGVYKDVNFSLPVTEIDWGVVEPSETKNFSAYLKNESNVPISLSMYVENWNPPSASSFIALSWNCEASHVNIDGSLPVTFTLNVSASTAGFANFNFTIVIVGSG